MDVQTGRFPEKSAWQVYQEYLAADAPSFTPQTANWTCLGTNSSAGGYAGIGRLNCIAFHPADNNTYWVGAPSGGLWMTANNGASWTCLTDQNGVLGISDIVIPTDYVTSKTIYIATGDRDAFDNQSIGVLKSTNGGTTWMATGLSYSMSQHVSVNRLLLDPGNNQILIAATSNGVYKTLNGGLTWDIQLTPLEFIDMEYKPGNFNILYGSTKGIPSLRGEIYISYNGGADWVRTLNLPEGKRIELAVSANQPSYVYAIVAGWDNGLYGIYRSTNSGAGFTQVFNGTKAGNNLLGWENGYDKKGQGWYDLCIAVSPSNANRIFIGGINTWRSTTGGKTWTLVNHWTGAYGVPPVHADKHMLKFRANGDLFECNDGGVYISTDNGTSWVDKTNGIVISQMYRIGNSKTVSNEVITGLQDNGTKLLSGGLWYDVYGGDGMDCLIDYSDVNTQYCSRENGKLYRTTNHCNWWDNIQPPYSGMGEWVTPFIIDPLNHNTLYAGYSEIWKTTDQGTTWTKISSFNSSKIESMAIAPSNNKILCAADANTIMKTMNGGVSWVEITGNLPVFRSNITSIAIKNDDPNTLWVSLGQYNAYKVYQSTNGGTSWTNISEGLPQLPVYTVVQNKQVTSEVHLYAGTELGIYFKKGSDAWIPYNTNLPNVKIGEIEIYYSSDPSKSKLRAGTYGRGLWETPLYYLDLMVSQVHNFPKRVQPGDTLTTSCTVKNRSTLRADRSVIKYYFSADKKFGPGDIFLGSDSVPSLGAGIQVVFNPDLIIPQGTVPGKWYILFIADANNEVRESDETNNIRELHIRVEPPYLPDLIVDDMNLDPVRVYAGQTANASCKVLNRDEGKAGASVLKYYLSQDNTFNANDILLGSDIIVPLASHGSMDLRKELTIPSGTQAGSWYILFFADADYQVAESNEANNVANSRITVIAAQLPDLIIKNTSANPSRIQQGQTTLTSCKVRNQGQGNAGASIIKYYLSADNHYSSNDSCLASETIPPLASNSDISISKVLTISEFTVPGIWYILFYADAENQVAEKDENNNVGSIKITVIENYKFAEDEEAREIINEDSLELKVFPNPTGGLTNIVFSEMINAGADIYIFNTFGKQTSVFRNVFITDRTVLHLESFPGGMYYIRMEVKGKYFISKIVITH